MTSANMQLAQPGRRLAFYLPSLSGGGAERVIVILANQLAADGYLVDLLLAKKEGPYLAEVYSKVNVLEVGGGRVLASVLPLVRYIRSERPAALLSSLMHANVIAALACWMSAVPLRFIIREANTVGVSGQSRGLKSRIKMLLATFAYRRADLLVGVSDGSLEALRNCFELPGSMRSKVILNPVVGNDLYVRQTEACFPAWPWADCCPVVLGVGRLVPQKGFSVLLRAFAEVRRRVPCHLIILGEGPDRVALGAEALALGVEADVWMPGFTANPFPHMRKASVYVLSSRWEGLPNTLIQAMACGAPVVATRCPSGPDEILENGLWGRLVPVDDVDSMAEAIVEVLRQPPVAPPASVLARYEVRHIARQYLAAMLGEPEGGAVE
ncbi:glycosyltransferase [Stutzerimonas balearica]|uniref:glycosyltransferase n=1 Tax=Stutzerimonas balearica TaxID=74829 RepID=UPI003F75B36F